MRTITARLTPAIKVIIAVSVLSYLVFTVVSAAKEPILLHLAVGPSFLREPWQVVTAIFVQLRGVGLFFDIIGLWFIGAYVERTQGTRRFLVLFFVSGVVANVAIGLVSTLGGVPVHAGLSPAMLALFVAYARMFGPVPTQLIAGPSFKATHLAIAFIVLAILADLDGHDFAGIAGTLAGSATAYLLAAPGGWRQLFGSLGRGRARYKVLDGGAPRRPATRARRDWN
jgi:membrane associated rhomboid family serine protease